MLNFLTSDAFLRLRTLFEAAGYNEPTLRKQLGAAELPSRELRNRARLLDRTSTPSELNALLRWFWLGMPQERGYAEEVLSAEFLSLLIESGLLEGDRKDLRAPVLLLPFEGFLVAADHPDALERKVADLVLWPNPTSKFLRRFSIQRQSRATLDLGTGSGILSLHASRFSDRVVATDLTPRAVSFAQFNLMLNGVDNVEVLRGDCFAPVSGRRFDLILSNPPFFITPQASYVFCDNTMELDGLCRRLVREAPAHLEEDGYLQMLCEWAQVSGQSWEERIAEWLQGTGCDAWVMKGLTQNPEEYAQHRIRETSVDTSQDAPLYAEYMNYYRERKVEAIHDGLIVMRRRDGGNFIRIEEVPTTPSSGDLGKMILATFAAHDLLREHGSDDEMLAMRPSLTSHVQLEQYCKPADGSWHSEALKLRLTSGFPFQIDVQPMVANFLASCDGSRTLGSVVQDMAARSGAPLEKVQAESMKMVRTLIERGFMTANPPSQAL